MESLYYAGRPSAKVYAYGIFEGPELGASFLAGGPGGVGAKVTKDAIFEVAKEYIDHPEKVTEGLANAMMKKGLEAYRRNYSRYKQWKSGDGMSMRERDAFVQDFRKVNYYALGKELWGDVQLYKHKQGKYKSTDADVQKLKSLLRSQLAELAQASEAWDVVTTATRVRDVVNEATSGLADYPPYGDHLERLSGLEDENDFELPHARVAAANRLISRSEGRRHGVPRSAQDRIPQTWQKEPTLLWTAEIDEEVESLVALSDTVVCATGKDVRLLDRTTGLERWRFEIQANSLLESGSRVIAWNAVWMSREPCVMHCIDPIEKNIVWSRRVTPYTDPWVIGFGSRVIVAHADSGISALSIGSGKQAWEYVPREISGLTAARSSEPALGGRGAGAFDEHYFCSNAPCGNEWEAKSQVTPKCPKCGSPAYTISRYRCPRCMKVFPGLDSMKLGPGQFRYRLHGAKEWQHRKPTKLVCPNCGLRSGVIYKHPVNPECTLTSGVEKLWFACRFDPYFLALVIGGAEIRLLSASDGCEISRIRLDRNMKGISEGVVVDSCLFSYSTGFRKIGNYASRAEAESRIYCDDLRTGRAKWSLNVGEAGPLSRFEGLLIVPRKGEGVVEALSLRNGQSRWKVLFAPEGRAKEYHPEAVVSAEGIVVALFRRRFDRHDRDTWDTNTYVLGISADTGTVMWRVFATGRPMCAPVVNSGTLIFVTSGDRRGSGKIWAYVAR